ncbi:MAG: cupin domain-containing protein [Acidimicrobiales bacterium]
MDEPNPPRSVDLPGLAARERGQGVVWSAPGTTDMHVNLVRLEPGGEIGAHVNSEVEVLIVGVSGEGLVDVDGSEVALVASALVLIPKGARRSVAAGLAGPLAYLSIHRARGGLQIKPAAGL